MVSQEGATSSGAASGATHILLRISEFASSPRKRGSSRFVLAFAGMTILRNRRQAAVKRRPRLPRVRAFGALSRPATIDSATLAFLSFLSP